MWQTKYALAVPKNLGVGVDFGPGSESNFQTQTFKNSKNKLIILFQENKGIEIT